MSGYRHRPLLAIIPLLALCSMPMPEPPRRRRIDGDDLGSPGDGHIEIVDLRREIIDLAPPPPTPAEIVELHERRRPRSMPVPLVPAPVVRASAPVERIQPPPEWKGKSKGTRRQRKARAARCNYHVEVHVVRKDAYRNLVSR